MIDNYNIVMSWLKTSNAAAIVCEFDGSGDSGSIAEIGSVKEYCENDNSFGVLCSDMIVASVHDAAEALAYAALEHQGHDWYNNDGGFGHVAILKDGRIICDTRVRYTKSTQHTNHFKLSECGGLREVEE